MIVDLPLNSANRLASVSDLLPQELTQRPIRKEIETILGEGYSVAVRFQIRFAGLVTSGSDLIMEAPSVEDLTEE